MNPYFFNSGKRRLFGQYHAPQGTRTGSIGVVFCNPFGQEAIRSHRMYRVLAERLTRTGVAALRFDYSSTGDSEGDCSEARLETWMEDVRAAERQVVLQSGATRLISVGLRLGATVALLAAERPAPVPRDLILWDPVVDGSAYLEEVSHAHIGFLANAFRRSPNRIRESRGIATLGSMTELVGFEMPAMLRKDIEGIDFSVARPAQAGRVTVLGNQTIEGYAAVRDLLARHAVDFRYEAIESDTPWNSEEALNASTIPARTMQAVQSVIEATG